MKVCFAAALTAAALSATYAADFCDQWGQTTSGDYIIYNNMWGKADGTTAKQCTGLDSGSGDTVAWHTTWSYQGGDKKVKSYANAALTFDPVPLTGVKSIPSTMEYTVKYSGKVVADVAYDLFTSSTAKGEKEFEIMIWLAAIGGAGPISSTGKAIDTTTIAGTEWSVFKGPNGQMMVYSFVASKQVENFEGDLMEFFNYLAKSQKFDMKQFLIKVECGTEPFLGDNVTMKVSKYSAVVNTGDAAGPSTGSSATQTQTTTAPAASSTGASEQTPPDSTTGSSDEPDTPSTGSSEQTLPASSSSDEPDTPSTGSSEQTLPASSTSSSDEPDIPTGSNEQSTPSSDEGATPYVTTAPATTSSSSGASSPSTPSTSSSSEETPSTPSTDSSPDQTEITDEPMPSTPESGKNCASRRVRRE